MADLHIHSKYSRACSRDLTLPNLALWARRKGVALLGTGDFTHPAWYDHLRETLVPAEPGLYRLERSWSRSCCARRRPGWPTAAPVRFMLSTEISTIYKRGDRTRKVHHLVYLPDLDAVGPVQRRAGADRQPRLGRPADPRAGLPGPAGDHAEADPAGYLVPAHIWTPWFSALGSKSGFDTIADCYADLADHIFAVETGLSSDPEMNWRVAGLDRYRLVSNSDAHSPPALAREATRFATALDYFAVREALRTGDGLAGTVEFFPEEGKYHARRAPGVRGELDAGADPGGRRELRRVRQAGDGRACSAASRSWPTGRPGTVRRTPRAVTHLVPLAEILGELNGVGARSKTVEGNSTTCSPRSARSCGS